MSVPAIAVLPPRWAVGAPAGEREPPYPNYVSRGEFRHLFASEHPAHHPDTGDRTAHQARQRGFEACYRTQEAHKFVFSDPRR
jgi:hypothetical protein